MGLVPGRDRLCLVQLSDGGGDDICPLRARKDYAAPNLKGLLADPERLNSTILPVSTSA